MVWRRQVESRVVWSHLATKCGDMGDQDPSAPPGPHRPHQQAGQRAAGIIRGCWFHFWVFFTGRLASAGQRATRMSAAQNPLCTKVW